MISRIVGIEQQRLAQRGYTGIATPVSIHVDSSLKNICLGNDTYILTGIRIGDTDLNDDRHTICLTSATDGLTATERDIALMGQSIYKTFRLFLIIRTMMRDESWADGQQIPPFTLDFIKITPIKKNN